MPGLKEVRSRIASVKSTKKITGAMKMVAASRLRQAQNQISHLRLYEKKLTRILYDIMQVMPGESYQHLMKPPASNDMLIICIGSNRGMCGVYNAMVIKHALKEIQELERTGYRVKLMTVGKKPFDYFKKMKYPILMADEKSLEKLNAEKASVFADHVRELYLKYHVAGVVMIYHQFLNAAVQKLRVEKLLPLDLEEMPVMPLKKQWDADEPEPLILEPSPEEVWHYVTSKYLHYHCYRILLDAAASEHGSRLTAMHQATDNADKLLRKLSVSYNKARQADITRELMDIMGGTQLGMG